MALNNRGIFRPRLRSVESRSPSFHRWRHLEPHFLYTPIFTLLTASLLYLRVLFLFPHFLLGHHFRPPSCLQHTHTHILSRTHAVRFNKKGRRKKKHATHFPRRQRRGLTGNDMCSGWRCSCRKNYFVVCYLFSFVCPYASFYTRSTVSSASCRRPAILFDLRFLLPFSSFTFCFKTRRFGSFPTEARKSNDAIRAEYIHLLPYSSCPVPILLFWERRPATFQVFHFLFPPLVFRSLMSSSYRRRPSEVAPVSDVVTGSSGSNSQGPTTPRPCLLRAPVSFQTTARRMTPLRTKQHNAFYVWF